MEALAKQTCNAIHLCLARTNWCRSVISTRGVSVRAYFTHVPYMYGRRRECMHESTASTKACMAISHSYYMPPPVGFTLIDKPVCICLRNAYDVCATSAPCVLPTRIVVTSPYRRRRRRSFIYLYINLRCVLHTKLIFCCFVVFILIRTVKFFISTCRHYRFILPVRGVSVFRIFAGKNLSPRTFFRSSLSGMQISVAVWYIAIKLSIQRIVIIGLPAKRTIRRNGVHNDFTIVNITRAKLPSLQRLSICYSVLLNVGATANPKFIGHSQRRVTIESATTHHPQITTIFFGFRININLTHFGAQFVASPLNLIQNINWSKSSRSG